KQPRHRQRARARRRRRRLPPGLRPRRRRARRVASWCSCPRRRARPKRNPPSAACRQSSRMSLAICSRSFAAQTWVAKGSSIGPWLGLSRRRKRRASSAPATRLLAANASFRTTELRLTLAACAGYPALMAVRAFITGLAGTTITPDERAFLREREPWGFIIFKRNIETPAQVRRLTASVRDAVGREAPVLVDQE